MPNSKVVSLKLQPNSFTTRLSKIVTLKLLSLRPCSNLRNAIPVHNPPHTWVCPVGFSIYDSDLNNKDYYFEEEQVCGDFIIIAIGHHFETVVIQ